MPTLTVPLTAAKEGVKAATNQLTHIQVRMASVEILVGGPYGNHPYGHTAIRVTTADTDKIYDYGRYGHTWGIGDSEGEGILKIWNNFDAYIADENRYGRVTTGFVYETSEENAKKVIQFFELKTSGRRLISEDRTKKKSALRIIPRSDRIARL